MKKAKVIAEEPGKIVSEIRISGQYREDLQEIIDYLEELSPGKFDFGRIRVGVGVEYFCDGTLTIDERVDRPKTAK